MEIKRYTKELMEDCIEFELNLRKEEDSWGWEIDEKYKEDVRQSFKNPNFDTSISLLAYMDSHVVGRIDSSMIFSHFDGSKKAYLDWICVLKSYRHKGVAQALMKTLREFLKEEGVNTLIGLIASNDEAQRFYKALPNSLIRDQGIWIDIL